MPYLNDLLGEKKKTGALFERPAGRGLSHGPPAAGDLAVRSATDGKILLGHSGGEYARLTNSGATFTAGVTATGVTISGASILDGVTITDNTIGANASNSSLELEASGTGDIDLNAGADVNIPANIGLTFGDDGEKIEGNGTLLTISSRLGN